MGKRIVFIDQNVSSHNDAQRYGSSILREVYYSKLKKFFENKDVTVALHPSNKDIDGLKCVKGKTEELIKNADLVYAHDSSAIRFAVENNKPIEFLVFDTDMSWFIDRIHKVAKRHNKVPIKMEA